MENCRIVGVGSGLFLAASRVNKKLSQVDSHQIIARVSFTSTQKAAA